MPDPLSTVPRVALNGDGSHTPLVLRELKTYALLAAAAVTGPAVAGIQGGQYILSVEGSFAGLTATLQTRALDGTAWKDVKNPDGTGVTATAEKTVTLLVGHNAELRMALSGSPSGSAALNATLAGIG